MAEQQMMVIEVAYALPEQQWLLVEQVPEGCSVGEALLASRLHQELPELVFEDGKVGIFGKAVKLSQPLRAGDRIEVYRPLLVDPREARRRKAAQAG